MAEDRINLMTAKEAAEYLRVSLFTLSKIERRGGIVPYRTPGGHRRYSLRMLNRYLNGSQRQEGERVVKEEPIIVIHLDPDETLRVEPKAVADLLRRILEDEIGKNEFLLKCGITMEVR